MLEYLGPLNPLPVANALLDVTGVGPAVFKSNLNRDNIEAIKVFLENEPAKTPKAIQAQNDFRAWYQRLGSFDSTTDAAAIQAKKYRDQFLAANITTIEEQQALDNLRATTITEEQMYGLKEGQKSLGDKLSTIVRWTGVGVIAGGAGLLLYKIVKPW